MSFFGKMKERLFKSSSKLDEGLAAIVDEGKEVEEKVAPAPTETVLPAADGSPLPVEPRDPAAPTPAPEPQAPRAGLFGRAIEALSGTRTVKKRVLDDAMLEELEELLITADMGVDTALKVSARLAAGRFGRAVAADEIKRALADEVAKILQPVARPLPLYAKRPQVVLVVGVNGSGKTTTIGKLASQLRGAGKTVVIAAGDTFRAAAVEQLQIWGERAGVPVMTAAQGSDPASLAFDAMTRAEREGADILL
ncbi:MAG TPA: signal recognition particle receptor subunit alpha, partial [Paracoccaceae bacterium]|nr:signal recognition particle receptor subunit alpha [Paracoccaceae bacterium]